MGVFRSMPTKGDGNRHLSGKKEKALELLLAGKTVTQVAKEIRVSRQTLSEWKNHDPLFIAELNRRRAELWDAVRERLRGLLSQAVDVLEEDLTSVEDRRLRQQAAVHILKALGIYGKENFHPLGPTTPEGVEKEWEELDSWAQLLERLG